MVLATAIPDLPAFASVSLAAQTMVLSNQALNAIVGRPIVYAPADASGSAMSAVIVNRQTLPTAFQGISATATNTGLNSTSQAAASISFTLATPPAARPTR